LVEEELRDDDRKRNKGYGKGYWIFEVSRVFVERGTRLIIDLPEFARF